MRLFTFLASCLLMAYGFTQENTIQKTEYWKQGKAEINVYQLSQNRYKDNNPGTLVSVFVTEDFLTKKQVKNEHYKNPKSTWTFKNIQLRKFNTGVYDYALFSSVFTPIDRKSFPHSLKVTATSQEWCGTIFTQLNLADANYQYQQRSYFEKEGDVNASIDKVFLEDEIFTVLRMNPKMLPVGAFNMIPALNFLQLKHLPNQSYQVKSSIKSYTKKDFKGEDLQEYKVIFPALNRTLHIVFESKAPYKIVGWLDSFPSVFDKKIRTTKVILKKQKMMPYWSQNSLQDSYLRKELGLE